MNIPFVDLRAQYLSIKSDIDSAILDTVNETAFIGGTAIRSFEQNFASLLGVKHCIGVANGTDAIYIILKMLGIGPGTEVITTATSWISTSETISQTGATPVFVDIDPRTYTIDHTQIEDKINSRTRAIIPVHLYGQAADIRLIAEICKKHRLYLIEDCAQSHLTEDNGQYVGTFGDAATFSFYPGKNLGAYGDAGAIVTNDDELAKKCRMYANHGALKKHQHVIEGINSRLDTIQAAVLNVKLPYLKQWTAARIENASHYSQRLHHMREHIEIPIIREQTVHTFHLYVIRTSRRDDLQRFLNERGVQTAIHYPTALPNLPAYQYLRHTVNDFPVASSHQDLILSLPMYAELSTTQIEYVCDTIEQYFKR